MIDLNMKPKREKNEPGTEELVKAIIAIALWTVIVLGWMGAF